MLLIISKIKSTTCKILKDFYASKVNQAENGHMVHSLKK